MKKYGLIFVAILAMFATKSVKAESNKTNSFHENYWYNNAVNFFERGIEFFIFTNGDFDFNTYNNPRRNVRIDRGFNGEIRRIGNVFINYDSFGNVRRIGSIFMNYHRGRLTRVGDLRVTYNRWGAPVFFGNVRNFYYNNGVRFSVNFGRVYNYNDAFFNHRNFNTNYTRFREDRNFYYYKARPNVNIGKRDAIVKRRKPASSNPRNTRIERNINNSYRRSSSINLKRSNKTERRPKARKQTRIKRESTRSQRNIDKSSNIKRNRNN